MLNVESSAESGNGFAAGWFGVIEAPFAKRVIQFSDRSATIGSRREARRAG